MGELITTDNIMIALLLGNLTQMVMLYNMGEVLKTKLTRASDLLDTVIHSLVLQDAHKHE